MVESGAFVAVVFILGCVMSAAAEPEIAKGKEWYAAPDGKAANTGAKDSPWNIETTFAHPAAVKPGDTIWLRGGTYTLKAEATSKLNGTKEAPIEFRQFPGERATINIGGFNLYLCGAWTNYRDFEITSLITTRGGRGSPNIGNATTNSPGLKAINLVIHDVVNFGFWRGAYDSELYGTIIYNNGSDDDKGQGHGHAVYVQNISGTKHVSDNICFNDFSRGIAPHGSNLVKSVYIEGNICFNSGSISRGGPYANLYDWAGKETSDLKFIGNFTYHSAAADGAAGVDLHCGKDITLADNYFVGGGPVALLAEWEKITMTGNRMVGPGVIVSIAPFAGAAKYEFGGNKYFCAGTNNPFSFAGKGISFDQWMAQTTDSKSEIVTGKPKGAECFVRPNKYEPGRANIAVYNWDKKESLPVDVAAAGLAVGDKYEIRDAQNWFGEPIITGTYDSKPITIPMTSTKLALPFALDYAGQTIPAGGMKAKAYAAPEHTPIDFGCFVIRKVVEVAK
jgi:hypothetical protein